MGRKASVLGTVDVGTHMTHSLQAAMPHLKFGESLPPAPGNDGTGFINFFGAAVVNFTGAAKVNPAYQNEAYAQAQGLLRNSVQSSLPADTMSMREMASRRPRQIRLHSQVFGGSDVGPVGHWSNATPGGGSGGDGGAAAAGAAAGPAVPQDGQGGATGRAVATNGVRTAPTGQGPRFGESRSPAGRGGRRLSKREYLIQAAQKRQLAQQ